MFPDPPKFSQEEKKKWITEEDYAAYFFEWYKFVSSLALVMAFIKPDSPAYKNVTPLHYYVLIGLLNRCSRLMLANVALSHEGKFGESTSILDRCISESAIKIIWLCVNPSDAKFAQYLADGLKTEIEFKDHILSEVSKNDGKILPIERKRHACCLLTEL
jgi:hypothetical protein